MRKFRSNNDNLRDTRISYLILLSLAVVCTVAGTVLTRSQNRAVESQRTARHRTLTECADSLREWETAGDDAARLTAAIRFRNAAAELPSQVELEPLLELADDMSEGDAEAARVRALADTFSMLSAVEYSDEAEARDSIGKTLNGVNGVVENVGSQLASPPAPEVLSYTKKVVNKSIRGIFDGHEGTMEPELSELGDEWTVVADNVRMSFDAHTGSLEAFVFIRVGAVPDTVLGETELLDAAKRFYCTNRRRDDSVEATVSGELCGFTAVDITDDGECCRVCIDGHGRVWSLVKVKR